MIASSKRLINRKRIARLCFVISLFAFSDAISALAASETADQKTIRDLTQVIKLHPKNHHAYRQRAATFAGMGEAAKAIADYTQAIKLAPRNSYYHEARAWVYEKQGKSQKAEEDFDKAVELAPRNLFSYLRRGDYYLRHGQAQKALDSYSQAIRLEPQQTQPYWERAQTYAQLNDFDRALADSDKVIAMIPHNKFKSSWGFAYVNRAYIFEKQGENSKAIDDCTKAITLQPNDWRAYKVRGNARGLQKDYNGAIADLSTAINLHSDAKCYALRAICYQKLGNRKDAKNDFTRATELDPKAFSGFPVAH